MDETVLVLNGPNLNLLGKRQPEIYGSATLRDVEDLCRATAAEFGLKAECRQSNAEHVLIEAIHEFRVGCAGIVINAGAWTHYSYGIRDALDIFPGPIIETHMSNIHAREEFRHHSVFAPVVSGQICGFGVDSYLLAVRAAMLLLARPRQS